MSAEVGEIGLRIADVDVVESMKENVVQCELSGDSGDSGAETLDTGSGSCATSSDSEVSPSKYADRPISNDGTSTDLGLEDNSPSKSISDSSSSKNCGSPLPTDDSLHRQDINVLALDTKNILTENDINVEINNDALVQSIDNKQIVVIDDCLLTKEALSNLDTSIEDEKLNDNANEHIENLNALEENIMTMTPDLKCLTSSESNIISKEQNQDFKVDFSISNKTLTVSTTSLVDQIQIDSIDKSKSHSRSAENISTLDNTVPSSCNSSTKDLNTEQILSEFTSQKNKVRATQKIITEPSQAININTDLRYPRIPKEILSQDLGSIAKSVHGIFSSVSGSLKNAYNNTHRVSAVKLPVKNIVKPVNGKLMNDIFEDNVPESNVASVGDNVSVEKEKEEKLNSNIEELGTELTTDDESKKDLMKLQLESLERVLAEQRKENSSLRDRVKQQMDELQAKDLTFKELEVKVDLMCKRAEQAQREKDAAVMRYASVECAAIEARRAADAASKSEKAAVAERELLNNKLRSARDERERICQLYDDKCHELRSSEAEAGKLREEARELDQRLKWTQSKLRVEMDAYKECSERAEKLAAQVAELEAAREASVASATDSAKAKQLEAELKESQATLILCRHEKEELERRWAAAQQQLDTCRRERDDASDALARANEQVQRLQESNLRLEEEAAELAALRAQAALADTLSSQLQRESERAAQAEEALGRERARAETCARREAAALEHAARLTANHVAQRAGQADSDAKVQALSADNASLRERLAALEAERAALAAALREEAERRHNENRVLARKVAELTEEAAEANKKLEWEKGENGVLKKKHSSAIKELNRELQRALKRCEQLEARLPPAHDAPSTRTGSVTSLSSGESAADERLHNGHADALPDVHAGGSGGGAGGVVPERQALIERIVQLQRAAARRAERCEFLEEHARALTEELRGKSRLLRRLLPALPAAALAPDAADEHKKEIARLGGGAMAALWGGEADGMPAELSLEVSRRLQALLEDTLLKNITLKENIDTLGEEIARLRKQVNSSNEPK